MANQSNQYFLTTLDKGLRILNLFNQEQTSLSLTEIQHEIGINKTSAYRFVDTLVQLRYLRKDPLTKRLKLGARALDMGYKFLQSFDLLQTIKPFIDQAYQELQITIDSALLEDGFFLILYRREARHTLTFRLPPVTHELYCNALGKAALAFLPKEKLNRILAGQKIESRTANTIVGKNALLDDLARTRARGYALNNEEYIRGLIAIGAPLFAGRSGQVVGSISFDFSTVEHSLEGIERTYSGQLVELAENISEVISMG